MEYNVDIVMCIDVTYSMSPVIDTVKNQALQFWPDLKEAMEEAEKNVKDVRVKVIGFRDFEADGENALQVSRFFNLSDEEGTDAQEYKNFVNGLEAEGGGPIPENSLEALTLALQSDWVAKAPGTKTRHIVVMFTDAPSHTFEEANPSNPAYPNNMPASLEELSGLWMTTSGGQQGSKTKISQAAKRLIIFAPEEYPWPNIYSSWDQVAYHPSTAGDGLDDVTYEDIINAVVKSV